MTELRRAQALITDCLAMLGADDTRKLIRRYGAECLQDVQPGKLSAFIEEALGRIEEAKIQIALTLDSDTRKTPRKPVNTQRVFVMSNVPNNLQDDGELSRSAEVKRVFDLEYLVARLSQQNRRHRTEISALKALLERQSTDNAELARRITCSESDVGIVAENLVRVMKRVFPEMR